MEAANVTPEYRRSIHANFGIILEDLAQQEQCPDYYDQAAKQYKLCEQLLIKAGMHHWVWGYSAKIKRAKEKADRMRGIHLQAGVHFE